MDFQDAPAAVTTIPDGFRVVVKGSIHTNVAWLERELTRVAESKPKKVELDLADVHHVSSMGIGSLIWFRNQVVKGGGSVQIVRIQNQVRGIFRAACLEAIFDLRPQAVIATQPRAHN